MIKKIFFIFIFAIGGYGEEIYASFDVAAKNSSALSFKSSGIVGAINFKVGDFVKSGDILAQLESENERLALRAAQNELETARLASEHVKRIYDKFKQVRDVTSKQNYEDAEFELKRAELALKRAQIAHAVAAQNLENKILRAPYDAVISKKSIELGEGVSGITQKVAEIFSSPEVKLVLSFDEKFKDAVKIGDEFKFKLQNGKERIEKIALIYPTVDKKNQKIYAEIYTKNLTPGIFGEGYITVK